MANFKTLTQLIDFQAQQFNNARALNFKENGQWRSFSNQQFCDDIFHFACGLKEIGVTKNQTLAICSYQNPIWLIVDFASILAGAVTVPIFDNISSENLIFEINDAKVAYFFTDNDAVLEQVRNYNPDIKIISYAAGKQGAVSFEEILEIGRQAAQQQKYNFADLVSATNPQDLATIIYTSGSTGKPKGVELTHQNLVSQIHDTAIFYRLEKEDVVLSFLPLAHIFERMVMMFYITQGVEVHFVDDVKNVGVFLREVQPNLMTTVPRVMEKVFARIKDNVENGSFFKKFLGQKAIKRALSKDVECPQNLLDKIFDVLVYKKFRAALGGKMRMMICGGAALSQDIERFYRNIGVALYCGYGMTECAPVLAANCPDHHKFGTVGKAFTSVKLKIAEDGELLASGSNIMRGYHNDAAKTAEVMKDGWIKTGDLAEIDADGFVKIIGRKKEVFKNANGKYVSPVVLEQKLMQNLGFLLGAVVIGEGRKFTSALLFPEFETLEKFKQKFNFKGDDVEFLQSKILQQFVEKNITILNSKLDHWEQIQKFHIATQPISIESGDITPSMKLKRAVLEKKYSEVIANFYAE